MDYTTKKLSQAVKSDMQVTIDAIKDARRKRARHIKSSMIKKIMVSKSKKNAVAIHAHGIIRTLLEGDMIMLDFEGHEGYYTVTSQSYRGAYIVCATKA